MAQSALDERTRRELIALLPRFRRFAWGLTGSSLDDADDLVQAACERAIARIDQWELAIRLWERSHDALDSMRVDGLILGFDVEGLARLTKLIDEALAAIEELEGYG